MRNRPGAEVGAVPNFYDHCTFAMCPTCEWRREANRLTRFPTPIMQRGRVLP